MAHTLSKEQIDAIKVELRKYGLNVLPMPGRGKAKAIEPETASPLSAGDLKEVNAQIAKLKAMSFKTAGVKSRLLRNLQEVKAWGRWRDAIGVTSFERGACYPYRGATADKISAWYAMPHDLRLDICKAIKEVRSQFRKAELALDAPINDFERLSLKVDNYQEWDRALKVALTDPKDMAA